MKKIFWLVVVIIVIIVIIFVVYKKTGVPENPMATSNITETATSEKKVICNVGPEVESDWCKLPTGQQLLLSMTGDSVYDNGDYYSFSRKNIDQGVYLYKPNKIKCAEHTEALSCDGGTNLLLIPSGSKDFYISILKQINDTYLQMRKDTDPQ